MADQTTDLQPYEPDPAEIRKAYWILGLIIFTTALFVFALIETILRHGNPLDVIGMAPSGGGGGH